MRVMALFSTSFFAKCLCVGEDGPGWGHLCHIDTFLVLLLKPKDFGQMVQMHMHAHADLELCWSDVS